MPRAVLGFYGRTTNVHIGGTVMNPRTPALLAALGFLVEAGCAIGHREFSFGGGPYHHLLDAGYAVAMFGSAVAVVPFAHRLSRHRVVTVAAQVAGLGFAAMGVESAVSAVHRVTALDPLFTVGIALAVLASLVLAVTAALTGRPRWAGALPLLAMVAAAAGGELGASVLSAALWCVAANTAPELAPVPPSLRAGSTSGWAA